MTPLPVERANSILAAGATAPDQRHSTSGLSLGPLVGQPDRKIVSAISVRS
jgi:hypothetical protein